MNTDFAAPDGSFTITAAQGVKALELFDKLHDERVAGKIPADFNGLDPVLAEAIEMGVAVGHALELESEVAFDLFQHNAYYQRVVEGLLQAWRISEPLRQAALSIKHRLN